MSSSDFANRVIELTNSERNKLGLSSLTLDSQLSRAALDHSADMALNDYYSHTGLNGSQPWNRMEAAGYDYSAAAENIAVGYTTPEEVVQAWMNSQGHRENILNPDLQNIGVGYYFLENDTGNVNYQSYWTQVFGTRPSDGANVVGIDSSETLQGNQGKDTMTGYGGDDVLIGYGGDDLFYGNTGNDTLYGNTGNDSLLGGKDNDFLLGGKDNDLLFGNIGNDSLYGNLGNDSLYGGQNDDLLYGGQNDDFLSGDLGNDILSGDFGLDTLNGGDGSDTFILQVGKDTDAIADFQKGDFLGLSGGLTFANLSISQGTGSDAANTLIRSNGELLAVLLGVQASSITSGDSQII